MCFLWGWPEIIYTFQVWSEQIVAHVAGCLTDEPPLRAHLSAIWLMRWAWPGGTADCEEEEGGGGGGGGVGGGGGGLSC